MADRKLREVERYSSDDNEIAARRFRVGQRPCCGRPMDPERIHCEWSFETWLDLLGRGFSCYDCTTHAWVSARGHPVDG